MTVDEECLPMLLQLELLLLESTEEDEFRADSQSNEFKLHSLGISGTLVDGTTVGMSRRRQMR